MTAPRWPTRRPGWPPARGLCSTSRPGAGPGRHRGRGHGQAGLGSGDCRPEGARRHADNAHRRQPRDCDAVGAEAGINRIVAEVLPAQKQQLVKDLQKEFGIVAMVGDGINDAPALKAANVGIAIGTGTDVAIESSDVTLVRGSLAGVVSAVRLSRATFVKIRQNLFWAFFYNVVAIPLAMLGLLHPIMAEVAMAFAQSTSSPTPSACAARGCRQPASSFRPQTQALCVGRERRASGVNRGRRCRRTCRRRTRVRA